MASRARGLAAPLLVALAAWHLLAVPDANAAAVDAAAAANASANAADPVPAIQDAIARLDECVPRLVPEIDLGYARIAAACPDLIRALKTPAVARLLPADWTRSNDLTAPGLRQLSHLLQGTLGDGAQRAAPSLDKLGAALARFAPDPAPTGVWAKFRAWLRRMLATPDSAEVPHSLPAWLRLPAPLIAKLIVGAAVLSILFAIFVVGRQLSASGILRRVWRRGRSPAGGRDAGAGVHASPDAALTLADIERAPLAEQPRLLLTLITPRLEAGAAAMTSAELRVSRNAGDLGPLLTVADAIRYSESKPAEPEIRGAVEHARAAIAKIGAARHAA